jgi:hypothetical protein
MNLPPTVQANEILYVLINLVGVCLSLWMVIDNALDLRVNLRNPLCTLAQRETSWSNLRNELGRLMVFVGFVAIGLMAMTTIPSPDATLPRTVSTLVFFLVALYWIYCSVKDRHLRLMLSTKETAGRDTWVGE